MTVMAEEVTAADPARPAATAIRRPGAGISIDPARLTWYRESRALSRAELARKVTALGWRDEETGRPIRLTRDAVNKFENPDPRWNRRPKPITLRAICEVLSTPEDGIVRPKDLLPGGPALAPHRDSAARDARIEHNTGLREFAEEHGIPYRKPRTGRIFYSKALRDAFAAASTGDPETERLIERAKITGAVLRNRGRAPAPAPAEVLSRGIENVGFTPFTLGRLRHHGGIATLGDLAGMTEDELLDIKAFGARSLGEVKRVLQHADLGLRDGEATAPDPEQRLAS